MALPCVSRRSTHRHSESCHVCGRLPKIRPMLQHHRRRRRHGPRCSTYWPVVSIYIRWRPRPSSCGCCTHFWLVPIVQHWNLSRVHVIWNTYTLKQDFVIYPSVAHICILIWSNGYAGMLHGCGYGGK